MLRSPTKIDLSFVVKLNPFRLLLAATTVLTLVAPRNATWHRSNQYGNVAVADLNLAAGVKVMVPPRRIGLVLLSYVTMSEPLPDLVAG